MSNKKNDEMTPDEMISISIAFDPLNPGMTEARAGINGTFYTIPRNTKDEEKFTEVPRQVAIILKEAGYPVSTAI